MISNDHASNHQIHPDSETTVTVIRVKRKFNKFSNDEILLPTTSSSLSNNNNNNSQIPSDRYKSCVNKRLRHIGSFSPATRPNEETFYKENLLIKLGIYKQSPSLKSPQQQIQSQTLISSNNNNNSRKRPLIKFSDFESDILFQQYVKQLDNDIDNNDDDSNEIKSRNNKIIKKNEEELDNNLLTTLSRIQLNQKENTEKILVDPTENNNNNNDGSIFNIMLDVKDLPSDNNKKGM